VPAHRAPSAPLAAEERSADQGSERAEARDDRRLLPAARRDSMKWLASIATRSR
jgi:hypothetical protein